MRKGRGKSMPAISKIRLTNVVYEDGDKRFNDDTFLFGGHNGAILLENGGGKTVFIHTVLQAVLPHTDLGERKIKETLKLDQAPAHIAIEWILNDKPRRYLVTAVSLYLNNNTLNSYRYAFEYEHGHPDSIEHLPFAVDTSTSKRPAYKEEINDYYNAMKNKTHNARTFDTLTAFHHYIEEQYQLIHNEWESIVKINSDEGGIGKFFETCKTTMDLYDRLLIPTVEDSIAKHNQETFADTFEKHRHALQTYHQLQKSMEEHQAIQHEMKTYIDHFKHFSEQQDAYHLTKQRAKGLAETITESRIAVEQEQQENERDIQAWDEALTYHQQKRTSYDILQEQKTAKSLESTYLNHLTHYEEEKEQLEKNKKHLYSLQYAKAKQDAQTYQQLLTQYKKERERHEEESDVQAYNDELAEEQAKLYGYFRSQMEQLDKLINNLHIECRPLMDMLEQCQEKSTQLKTEQAEAREQLNQLIGKINSKREQLDQLRQILAHPDQEDMQTEFDKWTKRHQWLDEEIIRLNQWMKTAEQIMREQVARRRELEKSVYTLDIKIHEKEYADEQMQDAHQRLINQLALVRPHWKTIADLHLQEKRVEGQLTDMQAKIRREREDALYKERLAHRFVDDYDGQDIFFSDAFLGRRLAEWQNQFYVRTGTDYYENLSDLDKETYVNYPLWPLTLITTEADYGKLLKLLAEIQDRLQYPITVLTLEEVKGLNDREAEGTWIAPSHWETNLDHEHFMTWKQNLRDIAEETTGFRIQKETEMDKLADIIKQFKAFFQLYPREKIEHIRKSIQQLKSEKVRIQHEVKEVHQKIQTTNNEVDTVNEQTRTYESEMNGLAGKMEKAVNYFKIERDVKGLTTESTERKKTVKQLTKDIRQLHREVVRYEEEIEDLNAQIRDHKNQIDNIKANPFYEEVKNLQPVYTDEAEVVLRERIQDLKFKIKGIETQYGEIVAKYEQAEKDIAREQAAMDTILRDHPEIETHMIFPVDGKRWVDRMREAIKTGTRELEKTNQYVIKSKEAFDRQDERLNQALERYHHRFDGAKVIKFNLSFDEIKPHLENEQQALNERKTFLDSENDRIQKQLTDIQAAHQHMDKFSVAHHFHSTVLKAIPLTESEQTEFTYSRMKFAKEITDRLRETKENLEDGEELIDRAKRQFRSFCRQNITKPKLREMAMEGIEIKTTYEDILEFQNNMLTTLENADQYARDFISKNDAIVQAFINNIHNHLINVVKQLKVIPNHTKVKVGDQWKEIYRFTIPEWTEEDGKSRIRDYMDTILEKLETDRFKNDQGLEDAGKVRKEVEIWLDTKQLLQVVMERQGMKVSCRKVTNDNQVSHRLTTWEQSNKWSGGEKWSKNMTLFLGILNFVAEKKQHIKTNTKRHRAVILDNPFGKASSDHVLSPVFFIAEQLGFQIIALTAHADGKFLQDYFPIIYSCRLRTASDGRKQVMGKEKLLHHAYFQDHEPMEMVRLEEREQMELF